MVTQEYYHLETSGHDPSKVEKIPYAGRDVLVRHFPGSKGRGKEVGSMAVVVGFVEGQYMRPKEGSVPVTTVTSVTDPSQRKELTDLLVQQGEKKPIIFWNP